MTESRTATLPPPKNPFLLPRSDDPLMAKALEGPTAELARATVLHRWSATCVPTRREDEPQPGGPSSERLAGDGGLGMIVRARAMHMAIVRARELESQAVN